MPEALTRTDGRWARILRALQADGPLSFEELFPLIRHPKRTYKVDRQKCYNAIWAMRREGLIEGDQRKLEITEAGRTSFARVVAGDDRQTGPNARTWIAAAALFALGMAAHAGLDARTRAAEAFRTYPADDLIERVQRAGNTQLKYVALPNNLDWLPYTVAGDCKTSAALKRHMLIKAGVKPGRLMIWRGEVETGEGHAVLVVDGDRVLDNRYGGTFSVRQARALGYRIAPCDWCMAIVRWESDLEADRGAPVPDFQTPLTAAVLHSYAHGAEAGAPGSLAFMLIGNPR